MQAPMGSHGLLRWICAELIIYSPRGACLTVDESSVILRQ